MTSVKLKLRWETRALNADGDVTVHFVNYGKTDYLGIFERHLRDSGWRVEKASKGGPDPQRALTEALENIAGYVLPVFTKDGEQFVRLEHAQQLREWAREALSPAPGDDQ